MKNILLPTDFSDNSWNAIAYALQLFKDEECNFYLLNTYTPIIYHTEQVLINPEQFDLAGPDAVGEMAKKNLQEVKNRIEKEFKNPKHTLVTMAVFKTLIRAINELQVDKAIDFIVMGTKGATGAKGVLFGSNTVHVFNSVKCPVLAVPEKFNFETPREILFPSDYNIKFSEIKIKPLVDIAKQYHSRVNILHVFYGETLSKAQESNRQQLENLFKGSAYLFHEVKNKNISHAITDFQLKARINLLVLVNNKHSFFENIFFKNKINQIGFHLNIPFLVIPSK
ncbi:universal stress protein [Lacinutrix sp. Bg11-31]|uniref:universal stress protein n=1 Tax=Lacinutrix sp. Bg11-31 TaxID=2057808 RepID=UPI000C2FFFEB|nr:universal stress protein [Lacinutrix sp. Bg11-31]AUC81128.1 universal stress protein [Lacinutrix sp. Bg11-31]